ncbi:MAG: FHA domain-containing protein [Cyanobacteriota bacterium]|nr:FHA domain-containing protein [Cyanobacteriota bacterium]
MTSQPSISDTQGERKQVRHVMVIDDNKGRRTISLEAATYSIGRDPSNGIVLNSSFASRQHAILLRVPIPGANAYLFRIIDGNLQGKRSTNGITVNGQRCYSHDLSHGDIIIFSSDVTAGYYVSANLSNEEFARYTEKVDFRSAKFQSSDPHQTSFERLPPRLQN